MRQRPGQMIEQQGTRWFISSLSADANGFLENGLRLSKVSLRPLQMAKRFEFLPVK